MILPQSDLSLIKFDILDVHMGYITPQKSLDELDESKYTVDLDFNVTLDEKEGYVFVYTSVTVNNNDAKFPCHIIDVDAGSVFTLPKDTQKEIMDQFIKYSAVPIAFNNVRGFIQNITSYCPIGTYVLPLFTMSELIDDKYIQVAKKIRKSTRERVVKGTAKKKSQLK